MRTSRTAAALVAGGKASDLHEGLKRADESVNSGAALRALDGLAALSSSFKT